MKGFIPGASPPEVITAIFLILFTGSFIVFIFSCLQVFNLNVLSAYQLSQLLDQFFGSVGRVVRKIQQVPVTVLIHQKTETVLTRERIEQAMRPVDSACVSFLFTTGFDGYRH